MIQTIIGGIVDLILVLPLLFYTLLKKVENKWKYIFLFFGVFVLNYILIDLPRQFPFFDLFGGQWNWTGKLYALSVSLIIYIIITKKFLGQYDFVNFKQKKNSTRPILFAMLLLLAFVITIACFFGERYDFTIETLLFQLLPGLEEELIFRGIMLGILLSIVKDRLVVMKINIGNPALHIVAILFGLVHGFSFNAHWGLDIEFGYLFITYIYGLIWGWMTLKSGSILYPIISHNLLNLSITLIGILK